MLVDRGLSSDASVHENVPLSRVAVHIAVKDDLVLSVALLDQLLGVVNRWMKHFRRVRPPPIQIDANQVAAVISNDHSIRVQHGDYFKYECVTEELGIGVILLQQELDGSLTEELGVSFARVDTRSQHNGLLADASPLQWVVVIIWFCALDIYLRGTF